METNTLSSAGSALIGGGLTIVFTDMVKGFILISAGVVLLISVAALRKAGLEISADEENVG